MTTSASDKFAPLFTVEDCHPRAKCCWCKAPLVSILKKRFWRCPTPACFKRQMAHAVMTTVRGKIQYQYIPLPIQTLFIETVVAQKYRKILFGGAAGVSKSHALRWLGHALCLARPGFKVLLLRRTFKQLENSHIQPAMLEAPALGGKYTPGAAGHSNSVQYGNDSSLKFGHCEKEGDEINYLSDEYDLILFDEETTFKEKQIVLIGSRARTSRSDGWNPMVAGGTNPGGISAQYCLSHFINKNPDPGQYPHYDPNDYIYIAGTLDDNPYLNISYEKSLDDLPRELREAYRFGNWNIFPGQYWKEYKAKIHTDFIDVPASVERFCSMDWGYSKPGVCLWWACLPDGKLYIEDEYVFTETIASEVAKEVKRRNAQRKILVRYTAADPSMWAKGGQTGESISETMRKAGLYNLRPGKNDRVNGWQRVRHLLRLDQDDIAFVRINPKKCPYLCRTFPQQVSDKNNEEDMDSSGEDHALDAMRYGAMSRPTPTLLSDGPRRAPREAVVGRVGELYYELLDAANRN